MIQYLPYKGTKGINKKEIYKFDVNSIGENSLVGYMLEVDLECPIELHELHSDYSLVPEKLEISHNILSKYCSNTANEYGITIDSVNKLAPNLGNKSKYFLHYNNLQLYSNNNSKNNNDNNNNDDNNNNNNEYISPYLFYLKLVLGLKNIYKKQILYYKIL